MAEITASETFDEEMLEEDVFKDIEPLVEWLNQNMQNIVVSLRGGLGQKNFARQFIELKAYPGNTQSVTVVGQVLDVQVSRIISQPSSLVLLTGFNWWPTTKGFDYSVTFTGFKEDRNIILKVELNV